MNKVVFWWNIPCEGMMGVFKSYYDEIDKESILITGTLSDSRKSMGWKESDEITPNHILIENEEWSTKAISLLYEYKNHLHVFNGISFPDRITKLIQIAIEENILFCNMSEAYTNLDSGYKYLIKSIYIHCYLPFRIKKIAKQSLGVMCLSGGNLENIKQFRRLGFKNDNIHIFGYYTDIKDDFQYQSCNDGKIHILCPGLHEKYKGVDILIKALSVVIITYGMTNFICHITGNGSQTSYLKKMTQQLSLQDYILFEGVLDSSAYNNLLSRIDMLIAPGRAEPWGIRVNEAIQRCNVVIVSDNIGASKLINESRGGKVFPSGNIDVLAEQISSYLQDSRLLEEAKRKNMVYKKRISCEQQAKVLCEYLYKMVDNQ